MEHLIVCKAAGDFKSSRYIKLVCNVTLVCLFFVSMFKQSSGQSVFQLIGGVFLAGLILLKMCPHPVCLTGNTHSQPHLFVRV